MLATRRMWGAWRVCFPLPQAARIEACQRLAPLHTAWNIQGHKPLTASSVKESRACCTHTCGGPTSTGAAGAAAAARLAAAWGGVLLRPSSLRCSGLSVLSLKARQSAASSLALSALTRSSPAGSRLAPVDEPADLARAQQQQPQRHEVSQEACKCV